MTLTNVKVIKAEQVWQSPDGQRKLYAITVATLHGDMDLKTWSQQIAKEGWTGDLETYEKEGKNGLETFARQPPKEGGAFGNKPASSKFEKDPFTMYISYAKDMAIASIVDGKFNGELYASLLEETVAGGHHLYGARPDGITEKVNKAVDDKLSESRSTTSEPNNKADINGLFDE